MKRPIKINFQPYRFDQGGHAVEKADVNGVKRRYLKGVATGINQDADGERLTKHCIESLDRQARSGDILLTADLHGKGSTEDVGILTECEISPNYDWLITARLYDKHDDIGINKLENCENLWKQMRGLSPYTKPKEKGFSIEGYLTDLKDLDPVTGGRIINDMDLDFVTVVPRPSYQDSVAHAIAKSLGSKTIWQIRKGFFEIVPKSEDGSSLNEDRWHLDTALDEVVNQIMTSESEDKPRELKSATTEYGDALINMLIKYEDTFTSRDSEGVSKVRVAKTLARLKAIAKTKPQPVRKKLEHLHTLVLESVK